RARRRSRAHRAPRARPRSSAGRARHAPAHAAERGDAALRLGRADARRARPRRAARGAGGARAGRRRAARGAGRPRRRRARGREPRRYVLATHRRAPPSQALRRPGWVAPRLAGHGPGAPREAREALARAGAELLEVPAGPGGVELEAALRALAARDVVRLLVE